MIQINLIPDVKRQYLQARRTRDIAISISILASIAAVGVVVVLLLALGAQAGREVLADRTIDSEYEKLSSVEGLSDMVTIDNQLSLISGQHANKSTHSRVFGILQAINPAQPNDVRFTDVTVQPEDSKILFEGIANAGYPAVEALTKTIENTVIRSTEDGSKFEETPLATNIQVGETSYGRDGDGRQVLRFELVVSYSPEVLTNKLRNVEIQSPTKKIDVTDSKQRVPNSLFSAPATDVDEEDS